jgi:putative transcriptional regulator
MIHPVLDELLQQHAAGSLPEPLSLAVATHLALSSENHDRYRFYEALGGALLDAIQPIPVAPGTFERLLARIEALPLPAESAAPAMPTGALPEPLRDYVPRGLASLRWRHYGPAAEADLPKQFPGHRARFIRVKAGRAVPSHTHRGLELTVILEGSYHDKTGHYGPGDLAIGDPSLDHQPIADIGQDCLCFAVTDAPLRLTGRFGRLLNPFLRA